MRNIKNSFLIGVGVVVLLVLIVLSIRNFYLAPREVTAENEMYKAQTYFATDSFALALNGDEVDCIGFKNIAADYSMTPSGNLASAYAGICYYRLDDYQNALKYLSQFDGDDSYLTTAVIGLMGDCYVGLGDNAKAISYFEKSGQLEEQRHQPHLPEKGRAGLRSRQATVQGRDLLPGNQGHIPRKPGSLGY